MEIVSGVFLILAAIGAIYYLLSTAALAACFKGKPPIPNADFAPAVSILKPVCGADRDAGTSGGLLGLPTTDAGGVDAAGEP